MKNFLKVVFFSLIIIGFFAGFARFGVPRVEPAPPPKAEKVDLSSMNMSQFIVLGEKIYKGRGTCTLCHNAMLRAPLLDKFGSVVSRRLADARYKGKAKNFEDYTYESMVKPSVYVVAGFGKSGTKDAESPMPDVSKGAIGLSEVDIKAVIAYLQNLSGVEVTVVIPTNAVKEDEKSSAAQTSTVRSPLTSPQAIMAKFTCTACHKIAGAGGVLGPDLSHIGAKRNKVYIRRAILDPNAEIAKGFQPMMPPIYSNQMYAGEVEILVNYLAGQK